RALRRQRTGVDRCRPSGAIIRDSSICHAAGRTKESRVNAMFAHSPFSPAFVTVLALTPAAGAAPQRGSTSSADAPARIVTAARALLSTLDEAGRGKVQFAFEDAAQKKRWSNLPSPMFQRQGLRLGDLTAPQRTA